MSQIVTASVVDKYALLFLFSDGKQVLFDFSRYEGEFWFDRIKERFADFSVDISGIWWGEDGISPLTVYSKGIDYARIAAVA